MPRTTSVVAVSVALAALASTASSAAAGSAAAQAPQPAGPLRILLTNDDGYAAPGIKVLFEKLTAAGHDVTMVAPKDNQSGTGTKINSAPAIAAQQVSAKVWAVGGTPGDSVHFGLYHVFAAAKPDLVISGSNFGQNPAYIANHSGTVGGAVAALERDVPAIAVSTEADLGGNPNPTLNAFPLTGDYVVKLVARLRATAGKGPLLPRGVGLNVNYPLVGATGEATALRTRITRISPEPVLTPAYTAQGDGTYAVKVNVTVRADKGSDLAALAADEVSITPIDVDWTAMPAATAATGLRLAGLRP